MYFKTSMQLQGTTEFTAHELKYEKIHVSYNAKITSYPNPIKPHNNIPNPIKPHNILPHNTWAFILACKDNEFKGFMIKWFKTCEG